MYKNSEETQYKKNLTVDLSTVRIPH